jgi:hypothetical protein
MTLRYGTGFDLCGNAADLALDGWTQNGGGGGGLVDIQATLGRSAGPALRVQRGNSAGNGIIGAQRTFATFSAIAYIGFAFEAVTAANASGIIGLYDGGTNQVLLQLNTDGSLTVTRNGTTLTTLPAGTVTYSTFHYFELSAVIHPTVGSLTLFIDGVQQFALTGINTRGSANSQWSQIILGGGSNQSVVTNFLFDDMYVCDGLGTVNNTFLGDVRVIGGPPTGGGTNTGMTKIGAAATNWQSVNNVPTDGDTTYVASAFVGTHDTYVHAALPANASQVLAVIGSPVARKDDAGNRGIATKVRSNGSEASSPATLLATSYATQRHIMETNPVTGAAWSVADYNAAETGPVVAS